ncbi:response regulator [Geobacter sp. FeAm09]|uniref:hybrid sensor histidine kinase/response regulator n=1 Tax=Geobacter sp. FeAm09 TaxID=2597769 RepID=UPI0011ECE2A9|nr:hybrid sensor histidine kinase/response regulator [Geobacter sp. FeAm09]QEM67997.1 response regulator [Geobacter sp. FeAm09]
MNLSAEQLDRRSPHILVVDDEDDILRLISFGLEKTGIRVSTAGHAAGARRLLEDGEFDAIITDVMMPDEDGITFLGDIHQRRPHTPIVIMTGYAQFQVAVNAIKNGAFDFISKPFDLPYLQNVVTKAVTYSKLLRMEKNYRAELEEAVATRTGELQNALAELEKTRTALLGAANEKSEFMATITHEMRTPMNGVIGALDLLADTEPSGFQKEYLEMARQSAGKMLELVDRLLSFRSGFGHGAAVRREPLDIPAALGRLAREHRERFAAKELSLEVRVAPDAPQSIACDGEQLCRLLGILLENALKFTEAGGVRLEVAAEPPEGPWVCFTVRDSGIGIPDAMLERIFDPFVQVDSSLTRRFGGVGLGLSIARHIATLLDGRLWAENGPGGGCSFHFQVRTDMPVPSRSPS